MYRNLNDYELVYMVREDCDDNFNIMYYKYKPIIFKTIYRYKDIFKSFGYEIDDLMQIGYITLYKTMCMYDSSSALFYSYFIKSLNNSLITEIRNNETMKKEVLNNAFSYDDVVPNTNYSYLDIIKDNKENNYLEEKRKFIIFKNTLSFMNACIFEMYYNGFNIKEISILLDKKRGFILKALKEIKSHALTQNYI